MAAALAVTTGLVLVAFVALEEKPWSSAKGETTYAVAESEDGRLLVEVKALALGAAARDGATESVHWSDLQPRGGRADLGERTPVASGDVTRDGLTLAQVRFGWAGAVVAGSLHELPIPRDTLRVTVPGEPGRPGDTLLLVLDANASLVDAGGVFEFRPVVSRAEWLRAETGAAAPGGGGAPESSWLDWEDRPGAAGGSGNNGGGSGGDGAGAGDVGRVRVLVRDVALQAVQSLNVTFHQVGVAPASGGGATTYFEGARAIDLRRYAGPEDRALLTEFQLPAGDYGALHVQFMAADGRIDGEQVDLLVPQPRLVLEKGFTVPRGATLDILLDFSIAESVVAGLEGFEFRPVVFQWQTSAEDTDGDNVTDVADPDDDNDRKWDFEDLDRDGDGAIDDKPAQYRTGGSPMPSIGQGPGSVVNQVEQNDPSGTTGGVRGDDDTQSRPLGTDVLDHVPVV